ncbi:MAG: ATP-dependent Clp protease adapter ClpS [Bdellovibrionales bacterium]|nr:ATP-dependent Clp protease adapter ClpS [Bdellovibrionales bacterium]
MSDDRPFRDGDGDELVITKVKPKTERPPLYRVILLNDDFTPMEFVILILKKFFAKSDGEAAQVMMQVHNDGAGLAGVYTFEVAETKVYSVNEFSRRHKHPLKCIMEKE